MAVTVSEVAERDRLEGGPTAGLAQRIITGADLLRVRDAAPGDAIRLMTRRHPAQVTADRLAEHLEAYADQLTPRELGAIERTVTALAAIASGAR